MTTRIGTKRLAAHKCPILSHKELKRLIKLTGRLLRWQSFFEDCGIRGLSARQIKEAIKDFLDDP